jgi:hypothetical protein
MKLRNLFSIKPSLKQNNGANLHTKYDSGPYWAVPGRRVIKPKNNTEVLKIENIEEGETIENGKLSLS